MVYSLAKKYIKKSKVGNYNRLWEISLIILQVCGAIMVLILDDNS